MHTFDRGKIHPTVLVGEGCTLGRDVTIGAHAIVHDNVEIGDGSFIGPHAILGEPTLGFYREGAYRNEPLRIGARAIVRSHSILYAGSEIGENFECGHRVTIREGSRIGAFVRIGTVSDVQGQCSIGDYVRMHSNVHVGQKSIVERCVWIFPYVVLTNDPTPPSDLLIGVTLEEFAIVATKSVVLPGVRVGRGALVAAMALVRSDVAPGDVVRGVPAKVAGRVETIRRRADGAEVYPWPQHFERGMPWEGVGFDAWARANGVAPL